MLSVNRFAQTQNAMATATNTWHSSEISCPIIVNFRDVTKRVCLQLPMLGNLGLTGMHDRKGKKALSLFCLDDWLLK